MSHNRAPRRRPCRKGISTSVGGLSLGMPERRLYVDRDTVRPCVRHTFTYLAPPRGRNSQKSVPHFRDHATLFCMPRPIALLNPLLRKGVLLEHCCFLTEKNITAVNAL